MANHEYDIAIIGSGIIGLFIAYELAHYNARILVIDKNAEPGFGVSKGHAGVIHVVQPPFNTLRSKLAIEGNKLYDDVSRKLHVKLKRTSTILVAEGLTHLLALPAIWLVLRRVYGKHGFKISIIGSRELSRLEPNVKGLGGIKIDGYGVINSFELVYQLYNFCLLNGVDFLFGTNINNARISNDRVIISTSGGEYEARLLVNAAGLHSTEIAKMFGDKYRIEFGKGAMLVFWGEQTRSIVAPLQLMPNPKTKGGAIIPTIFGTTIWGPSLSAGNRDDRAVNENDIQALFDKFKRLMPGYEAIPIKAYAGVRPIPEGDDFIITHSNSSNRVIHLIGIESPGLTAAPAIARKVIDLIKDSGIALQAKSDIKEVEPIVFTRDLISDGKDITDDSGEVVCPCIAITRSDIRNAIKRGARTLDGVAFITGLGMGICQGMCIGNAIKVISEELGIDPEKLTKSGGDSWLVTR